MGIHCLKCLEAILSRIPARSLRTSMSPAQMPVTIQQKVSRGLSTISLTGPVKIKVKDRKPILTPGNSDFLYTDPAAALQKYVEAPLFNGNEKPFVPTKADMLAAQEIFRSTTRGDIRMIDSMIDPERAPLYDLPEIAFLGQSNVGKSSLIRAIFKDAPDVKVPISKIPGYTKTLRFYQVKDYFTMVDMPGYGFGQPEYFQSCVEGFLRTRRNVVKTFIMFDTLNETNLENIRIMEQLRIPYCVVLNKIDLANETARLKKLALVRQVRDQYTSPSCFPQPFFVSSKTGEGLAYIQTFIAYITGALALEAEKH